MRRVIIIANCHSMSLARAFALGARGVEVNFFDLNFIGRDNENNVIQELYSGLSDETLVFSFPTAIRFGDVASAKLAPLLGARYRTFTNLRFDGLHPDITYIGPMTSRRHSALGTYHSKIILYAFTQRMTALECCRLFDGLVYEKLGYFGVFATSEHTLRKRELNCDIKFAATFLGMLCEQPSLYTFNHPTGSVFQALTSCICNAVDLSYVTFDCNFCINELSNNYIWPIYDEIAEHHRLQYRTPQFYCGVQSFTSRTMSRWEMVSACYDIYERQDGDVIRGLVRKESFYEQFLSTLG